tara:strand:+ start:1012 stop:2388 length:1377 start_codon:yes stop_codon:yes gene_type:complete
MLEVKIGKLVQSQMAPDDILSRKMALSYFLISTQNEMVEAHNFLKQLSSNIYANVFACDPTLEDLQVSLHTHQIPTNEHASIEDLKSALFKTDDSDGWGITIGKENYFAHQSDNTGHDLVLNVIRMRKICDHILAQMRPLPSSDNELKSYTAALIKLSEASQLVNSGVADLCDLNVATQSVNAPTPEPVISPPPQEIAPPPLTGLQQDLIKQIGEEAELVYFPIWAVEKELVNTYRGGIIRNLPSGTVELNTGTETHIASYKIDQLVARKVREDMRNLIVEDEDDAFTFVLPIHMNTLQSKEHFLKIDMTLKTLSIAERKNLKIEILGATQYTTAATVLAMINKVKLYCSGVGFRKPNTLEISPAFKKMGITHVGFHIDDLSLDSIDPNRAVEQLGETADKANLSSFVYGVNNVAISALSIGAGINFISGEAIGSPLETPWGSLPFAVESLYTKVLSN